jgi:site-specific recombinase XerD
MSGVEFLIDSPLAEQAHGFLRSLRAQKRSVNTQDTYLRGVLELDKFLAANDYPREVQKIKRGHVEEFLQAQLAQHKPATASIRYSGLHRFFAWCVAEQEIAVTPMGNMLPPRIPETLPMVITEQQVEAILNSCRSPGQRPTFRQRRDEAILRVLIDCGIRRMECANLTVSDINLDEETLLVRLGKGAKTRTVTFSPQTAIAIDRYLRQARSKHRNAETTAALWLGPNGALTSDGVAEVVIRRSRMAGVTRPDGRPLHPHLLRHFRADRWMTSGMPLDSMMELGGWSDAKTAMRYGRARRSERAIEWGKKMFAEAS